LQFFGSADEGSFDLRIADFGEHFLCQEIIAWCAAVVLPGGVEILPWLDRIRQWRAL
jgi:hypothetical protein